MTTSVSANPAIEWKRAAACIGAVLLVAFACLFAVGSIPDDPYIRYQQLAKTIHFRTKWIYERIHFDPTPIDIAVIGNSRLGAGVPAPEISSLLSASMGRPVHVVNLSLPQEGRDVQYAVAKRLLDRRPEVKLLIVSVIEQMPRVSHPAFKELADGGDVVAAPLLINRDYAANVARLPFRQLSMAVQSLAPERFGVRRNFRPSDYPGSDFDSTLSFTLPDGRFIDRDSIVPERPLAVQAAERLAADTPPLLPAAPELEFSVERTFTRKLAMLARSRGVSLIFLRLPIYSSRKPIASMAFYDDQGRVIDLSPGLANDATLFSDYGHLNRRGALTVARLLAPKLDRLMRDTSVRRK